MPDERTNMASFEARCSQLSARTVVDWPRLLALFTLGRIVSFVDDSFTEGSTLSAQFMQWSQVSILDRIFMGRQFGRHQSRPSACRINCL
jgi:hypothetical protein